nr:cation diffusion facilitator family transporter [bacterium]
MTNLLLRLFVPNLGDGQDVSARRRVGFLSGFVGILVNLILFAGKLAVGLAFSSVSITADAVNNLSDSGTSILSVASARMANKPADEKHPFGHARVEYIISMIIAFVILMLGLELIKSSVAKIITPEASQFSWVMVGVLAGSILAKGWLYLFNRSLGRRTQSTVLLSTAADSLSDVLSTSAVLLSSILSPLIGFSLDGYMGVLVAVFIMITAVRILMDTFNHLIGQAPTQELVTAIDRFVHRYEGVQGIHDLVVHSYGPGRSFASLHVEVNANEDILKSHDMIDNIERDIAEELGIHLVIHLDPIVVDDPKVNQLRQQVQAIVRNLAPGMDMHDFRVVFGHTHTNLIFDIVVPHGVGLTDEDIIQHVSQAVQAIDPHYFTVITLDRSFVSMPAHATQQAD